MKKHLGLLINLAAIVLFVPGILLPMFSLTMNMSAQVSGSGISTDIINKELSLITTIEELWLDDRILVAILIFLFSIAIPVIKTSLVTAAYFIKQQQLAKRLVKFVHIIGKWSMADVFVIAIFLAVLSTNHAETASQEQISMFAFKINLLVSSETASNVGYGFYYFTSYCIFSIIGTQLSFSALQSTYNNHRALESR